MIKILKNNLLTTLLLTVIFAAAVFVRTIHLSNYPAGFHIDEASLGYNGYSILLTGMSDEGKKFPLYVDMFGDNRPTGYHYLTAIPTLFFGLSEFSTRLPSAIFGALTVFPFFLLAMLLFKSKKIALLSALFLSISPWSFVLSRASAETIVALFFILLGFYLILNFIQTKGTWMLTIGTLSLIASFFFYHTPRVFVPMYFFVSILVLFWPINKLKDKSQFVKLAIAFLCLGIVSFALIFIVKGGTGRFSQVNIFGHPETRLVMEEQIREDGYARKPLLQTRMFHNKLVNYPLTFVSNYFSYFTGDVLFISGGLPIWYKVDKIGLILLAELPFIIYGAYLCFRSKDRFAKLPLFWILVAPITASLTMDDVPNLQRAIVLFPMLELLAALGAVKLFEKVKSGRRAKKIALSIFVLLVFFNFSYFLHQYFVHGRTHRTWYRNNGFNEVMQIVNGNYEKYEKIVMTKTGGGYPLVLFYSKFDPAYYQAQGSPKDKDFGGFGKYMFIPSECPSSARLKLQQYSKILFVDRGTCEEPGLKSGKKFKNVYREDGSLGFRIIY